ncbi:MAG: signal peptidase II [Abitibacteriaceae bacterium]|nr:signal peptidase II [Abditibacteriaceae bacterium]MBV9864684.1 signal peptidase II [Abditibacteriaceae bacterium]
MDAIADTETRLEPLPVVAESNAPQVAAPLKRRFIGFLLLAVGVVLADQWSKYWLRGALPLGETRPLVPGWVHLSHFQNHGAAWSMLSGQRLFLVGITLLVIFVVGRMAPEIIQRGLLPTLGLGLILGGAVGNLIDRILFASVTDFIDLDTTISWIQTFPVFNLADSALTVGVTLLLINFVFGAKPPALDNSDAVNSS